MINAGNGKFIDSEGKTRHMKPSSNGLFRPLKEAASVDVKEVEGPVDESEVDINDKVETLNEDVEQNKVVLV